MNLMKLYPPLLEASLPAFTKIIKIPFQHNDLVALSDIIGIQIQIKELNGKVIYSGKSTWGKTDKTEIELDTTVLGDNLTNTINWYKISIAYIGIDNEIGYFSSAAVAKYLGKVTKDTFGLKIEKTMDSGVEIYTGSYYHNIDSTEKEFSYQFILQDPFGNVIADTGVLLHNIQSEIDLSTVSYDKFICNYRLQRQYKNNYEVNYKLLYKVETVNGYKLSTSVSIGANYIEKEKEETPFLIETVLNRENGSVKVILKNNSNFQIKDSVTGSFLLRRVSSKDNYCKFLDIKRFNFNNINLNELIEGILLFEDFTVESGKSYRYYIQQLNKENNIYINSRSYMSTDYITVYFDDMFLYDGEKQLNIKFNPKIASFKTTIQGTKIETIGNQYPHILYNGKTSYKEFPISGLISYNIDENQTFIKHSIFNKNLMRLETNHQNDYIGFDGKIINDKRKSVFENLDQYQIFLTDGNIVTDLTDLNRAVEKDFKLAVLNFLNDKKPKLFRSGTEGNYCVALLNSTLTPIDSLGRMLHSFNCNAYEIMEVDEFVEKLILEHKNNVGLSEELQVNDDLKIISLTDQIGNNNLLRYKQYVKNIKIENATPMSTITLGKIVSPNFTDIEYFTIVIGSTGVYNYTCFEEDEYIAAIYLGDKNNNYNNQPLEGTILLQNTVQLNESLFDNNYIETQNNILGKEIVCLKTRRPYTRIFLIYPFYNKANNENYGYLTRLDKIYNLKVRNFSLFSANTASFYIGTGYSIQNEIREISRRNLSAGAQIYMSATLKTFIENNALLDDFFVPETKKENYINRLTSSKIEDYDTLFGSEFYIKYKLTLKENIDWETVANLIYEISQAEINENTQKITLLPQEEKDIVINLELNPQDFIYNNCCFTYFNVDLTSADNTIYDIRYNIVAEETKFTFYEGQEVK